MAKKMEKELKDMIGKLPDNWQTMSLEEKMGIVFRKFNLLQESDMYEQEIRFTKDGLFKDRAWLVIEPTPEHQFEDSNEGSCFALTKPVKDGEFDIKQFPEYLRKDIEERADKDWKTGKKDYNMLYPESESGTFAEAAESMYFMLDLLTCGYELTEAEWYKEEHRDLYPDDEDDDDDDML